MDSIIIAGATYKRVPAEKFFDHIGPLNVALEITGDYPYKTWFWLKGARKLVGFEEHERYYLREEDLNHG